MIGVTPATMLPDEDESRVNVVQAARSWEPSCKGSETGRDSGPLPQGNRISNLGQYLE
jgi:hypothetical protein